MDIDLSDRVVAVTGASSGIGEATGLACTRAGAAVALAARRSDRIDALAQRIEGDGGRAIAVPTDLYGVLYRPHAALPLRAKERPGPRGCASRAGRFSTTRRLRV